MSSLSSQAPAILIVSLSLITTFTSVIILAVPSTTAAAPAYAGSFELPQTSPSSPSNGRRQSSPPSQLPPANVISSTEACSNASMRADFGTACLKRAISQEETPPPIQSPQNKFKKSPVPGRSRYFAVKPMMVQQQQKRRSFGVKSPALSARELYASKGYQQPFPVKSVRTLSGSSLSLPPVLPANRFYRIGGDDKPLTPSSLSPPPPPQFPSTPIDPTAIVDDEWGGGDAPERKITPLPSSSAEEEAPISKFKPSPSSGVHHPPQPQPQPAGQYSEELEMLRSLKRSLGVLSAQALNLKQRSALLYREARRRKLYFFDSLLSRTHTFLSEKTEETRNALSDIDTAIGQIEVHHREAAALEALRRTFYFYQQSNYLPTSSSSSSRSPLPSTFTSRRMRKRNSTSKVDPREVDQLIMDALAHAKRMMSIVRELNEAMDEFEEQFNLPRYEPNRVLLQEEASGSFNSVDGRGSEEF